MTGQIKMKPLITTAAAIGSLLLLAACNSSNGANSYSTGDTNGTGYYQTGTGTGNNYASSLGWETTAQQNQFSADQNEENISESNGIGDTVDSGDDGGS